MFDWLFKARTLQDHLRHGKKIRVENITFFIRKINIMDYLEGGRVMAEIYSTYKTKSQKEILDKSSVDNLTKLKKYLTDIILAGVIYPKLTREPLADETAISIDELFSDWVLAQKLAEEILAYTYGKKK